MKIVTWNCNMAFRKKAHLLIEYKPDIVIIPECEHPDKLVFPKNAPAPTDILWFGTNKNKGLGILSYNRFRLRRFRDYNESIKFVAPVTVSNDKENFMLYAIWANNPTDPDGNYITQVWKAINYYNKKLKKRKTMLIGDFNSNTIWDKPRRIGNHSTVVQKLEIKGIYSVYHKYYNQIQGQEQHPTLYLHRSREKPYHIDYCFVSEDFLNKLESVEIGSYDYWIKFSDHVPIIVSFREE